MKPEYREGPEVREEFERTMEKVFRAPKPQERKQPKPIDHKSRSDNKSVDADDS
jgi:hypothetical protein